MSCGKKKEEQLDNNKKTMCSKVLTMCLPAFLFLIGIAGGQVSSEGIKRKIEDDPDLSQVRIYIHCKIFGQPLQIYFFSPLAASSVTFKINRIG